MWVRDPVHDTPSENSRTISYTEKRPIYLFYTLGKYLVNDYT